MCKENFNTFNIRFGLDVKTVTSIHEMFDPVVIDRNKPRFLFIRDNAMADHAGSPRTNVYKRDTNLGNGPAN